MKKEAKYKIFPKWGRIEVTDDNEKWKEDNKWLFETPKCENCKFCRDAFNDEYDSILVCSLMPDNWDDVNMVDEDSSCNCFRIK